VEPSLNGDAIKQHVSLRITQCRRTFEGNHPARRHLTARGGTVVFEHRFQRVGNLAQLAV